MRAHLLVIALSATTAGAVSSCAQSPDPQVTAPAPKRPQAPRRAGAFPVSNASAHVVAPQPAPGSCHAKSGGVTSEPDPACTPGALSPAVTQSTIGRTICVSGYSKSVRPPESVTKKEKVASMAAYGDGGSPSDYEYDHLVSLELGGAANDPRNLWPEPGSSPNPKDSVENALHRMVCDGEMQLSQAQLIIARDWAGFTQSHAHP